MIEIPYWEKYMLTLREAAEYFHIGEKKMRQIVDENMDAKFLLESGNRVMIKRKTGIKGRDGSYRHFSGI